MNNTNDTNSLFETEYRAQQETGTHNCFCSHGGLDCDVCGERIKATVATCDDLPEVPTPAVTYADHSYPAYSKAQMLAYGAACRVFAADGMVLIREDEFNRLRIAAGENPL